MPIPLRADFDAAGLRSTARRTKDAAQARRLLAIAMNKPKMTPTIGGTAEPKPYVKVQRGGRPPMPWT